MLGLKLNHVSKGATVLSNDIIYVVESVDSDNKISR